MHSGGSVLLAMLTVVMMIILLGVFGPPANLAVAGPASPSHPM
jgi:hypothetical protein